MQKTNLKVVENKEPSPHYLARKFFTDLYQQDFGIKYKWDKGKDSKLFDDLWDEGCDQDLDRWKRKVITLRIQIVEILPDKRIFKLRDKETYTIPILSIVWNELPIYDFRKICAKCFHSHNLHKLINCEFIGIENYE